MGEVPTAIYPACPTHPCRGVLLSLHPQTPDVAFPPDLLKAENSLGPFSGSLPFSPPTCLTQGWAGLWLTLGDFSWGRTGPSCLCGFYSARHRARAVPSSADPLLPRDGACGLEDYLYILKTQGPSPESPGLWAPVNETATLTTSQLPVSTVLIRSLIR